MVQITFKSEHGCSQEGVDNVFLMKVNSVLALLLIFLEMWYLYKSKQASLYCLVAVEGLYDLGKMHILATNVCLWIKILTKETVVFALQTSLEKKNIFWQIQSTKETNKTLQTNYSIPISENSCDTFNLFGNPNTTSEAYSISMWTMEEGFYCEENEVIKENNHFGSNFFPFLVEFSLMMIFVLYEMIDQECYDEEPTEKIPEITFRMTHLPGVGMLLGLIPIMIVCIFKILTASMEKYLYHAVQTGPILITVIPALFIKNKTSITKQSSHFTLSPDTSQ